MRTAKKKNAELEEEFGPYRSLSVAEAEAERAKLELQAEKDRKEKEEIKKQEEKEKAEKAAAKKAKKEAEEKKGYNTGITYEQLARTPDDYEGKKVKFKGKVIQVIEAEYTIQIRLAIDSNYDKVIYCEYDRDLVSSRILEDDVITIYGVSTGIIDYESVMGGQISVPSVWIDKIEQ